MNQEEC